MRRTRCIDSGSTAGRCSAGELLQRRSAGIGDVTEAQVLVPCIRATFGRCLGDDSMTMERSPGGQDAIRTDKQTTTRAAVCPSASSAVNYTGWAMRPRTKTSLDGIDGAWNRGGGGRIRDKTSSAKSGTEPISRESVVVMLRRSAGTCRPRDRPTGRPLNNVHTTTRREDKMSASATTETTCDPPILFPPQH